MANWANPTLSSSYTNFLAELKARDDDLARGLDPAVATVTSPPTNAIRWNSASKKWQKWSGSAWGDLSASYAINVEGTLAAPAGSVGAPSIVFQGSATTGFYRPAADRVALAIAGVQRLWVGGTGRFSFGAGESPAGVVSIAGGNFVVQETGVNRALAFLDAAGSTAYGEFGAESASGANVAFVSNPRAGGTVALRVAGTNRLTVTDTAATFSVPITGVGSGLTGLPAATESATGVVELATSAEVQVGTDAVRAITPASLRAGALLLLAQPNATGTVVDVVGIPAWAKRITVVFRGIKVGTNSRLPTVLLGQPAGEPPPGGGPVAPSFPSVPYVQTISILTNSAYAATRTITYGFAVRSTQTENSVNGTMVISKVGNWWIASHTMSTVSSDGGMATFHGAGSVDLTGFAIDRLRLTTIDVNDANAQGASFTAGFIAVFCE